MYEKNWVTLARAIIDKCINDIIYHKDTRGISYLISNEGIDFLELYCNLGGLDVNVTRSLVKKLLYEGYIESDSEFSLNNELKQRNWSIEFFATLCKFSKDYIRKAVKGERMSKNLAKSMSDVLRVDWRVIYDKYKGKN